MKRLRWSFSIPWSVDPSTNRWLPGFFSIISASQQQNGAIALANMATAVSLPVIFGDERDAILAKWNQLQAFWGTGKGFFNREGAAVDFSPDNPFCRFKVGYCISS